MKRPTIAFLTFSLTQDISRDIWRGVYDAAKEADVNLVCYVGESIDDCKGYNDCANWLYDYIAVDRIDGLIVWGGALGQFTGPGKIMELCTKYSRLPIVNIAMQLPKITSIVIDNYKGMYDSVNHLIRDHRMKAIAFVKGPEGHPEAEERFQAYKDALRDNQMPFREEYVAPGEFERFSGSAAVELLIDQRKLELEAVVTVDDETAFGVYDALRSRKIKIPQKIAVCGFDDMEEAASLAPALTSVAQPLYEQGVKSVQVMLELLAGKPVAPIVKLPTVLVRRQSCGCLFRGLYSGMEKAEKKASLSFSEFTAHDFEKITATVLDAIGEQALIGCRELIGELFISLHHELHKNEKDRFVNAFNRLIGYFIGSGLDPGMGTRVLSEIRKHTLPHCGDSTLAERMEDKIHDAEYLLGKALERQERSRRILAEKKLLDAGDTFHVLSTIFQMDSLFDALKENLPALSVTTCYIGLLGKGYNPGDGVRLKLAHRQNRDSVELPDEFYPIERLIPDRFWESHDRFAFIVEPLYVRKKKMGIIIFETESDHSHICDTLRWQISGLIQGIEIIEEQNEMRELLARQNSRIIGLVTPMIESMNEAARILNEKMSALNDLESSVGLSRGKIEQTNLLIDKITMNISQVLETINLIDGISAKVNLFAINASIESTHAGRFGKGFSVIAAGIKKLADSTAKNAQEITLNLNNMIGRIKDSSRASRETLETVARITQNINEVHDSLLEIFKRVNELSAKSNEMLAVMNER